MLSLQAVLAVNALIVAILALILKGHHCIDASFTGDIHGEIVMSFANFNKFKELHPEAKNPRNSVAGIINGKELVDEPTYRVNVKNSVDQSNERINAIKEVIK